MKKLTVLLLFLVLVAPSIFAQNFNLKYDHDAFLVEDINVSVAFYEEVLGLKQITSPNSPSTIKWFSIGDDLQLHLIQGDTKEITKHKSVHLSLRTDNIDALVDQLIAKNIRFENWQGEENKTNTRSDNVVQVYVQDPDGYWLEINTR